MTPKTESRCVVCGKPVTGKGIRITRGTLRNGEWSERSLFGDAHESCFASAVESPKMVVDELRRSAREPLAGQPAR